MLRHVVMMRWRAGTPPEVVERLGEELAALHARTPTLLDYRYGPDVGLVDGNWDYVVVADFATDADYVAFRDDLDHREMIERAIAPHRADRAAVQLRLPD
ncbi:MAG TPA: Dabb family protein [Acidimicrobiales bacterium]|nr:Dabb family protein [Acidimicrobiales bacterium]